MVRLHVKRHDESQFLFDTSVTEKIDDLVKILCAMYNGRLKIFRICDEIENLAEYGIALPPEMVGLLDDQIEELKLKDSWEDSCIPSGGYEFNKDPVGKRNGRRPMANMQKVLTDAIEQSKKLIDKSLVKEDKTLIPKIIDEAMSILKGAVAIVYPMQLPPHDSIRLEFTNLEDLSGKQALKEIIEPAKGQLWFAGKQMLPEKTLMQYVGPNDKSKIVVKLTKFDEGPPGREPIITEDIRKRLMAEAYRRQEDLKVSTKKSR